MVRSHGQVERWLDSPSRNALTLISQHSGLLFRLIVAEDIFAHPFRGLNCPMTYRCEGVRSLDIFTSVQIDMREIPKTLTATSLKGRFIMLQPNS